MTYICPIPLNYYYYCYYYCFCYCYYCYHYYYHYYHYYCYYYYYHYHYYCYYYYYYHYWFLLSMDPRKSDPRKVGSKFHNFRSRFIWESRLTAPWIVIQNRSYNDQVGFTPRRHPGFIVSSIYQSGHLHGGLNTKLAWKRLDSHFMIIDMMYSSL